MKKLLIKSLIPVLLFFIGGAFVSLQAMPPKVFRKEATEETTTTERTEEQSRRITDSDDDDLSSEEERGIIIGAKEEFKSDYELSYTALADSSEAVLAKKIQEIRNAQQKWEEISSLQITEDLLPANRDVLLEQVTKHLKAWKQQKENEDPLKSPEALLLEYDKLLEQLSKIQKRLIESTDPLKGSVKKLSLEDPISTPVKSVVQAKKKILVSDTEDESSSSDEEGSSSDGSSDASPYSSDEEFGAKTFMRKIRDYVYDIEDRAYAINQDGTEEITEEEIRSNPGMYYVANFRGDYLKYFKKNKERRAYVRKVIESTVSASPIPYKSIAVKKLEEKYPNDGKKVQLKFDKLKTPSKLQDSNFIKTYKSPTHFDSAIKSISPDYGSPLISSSKDVKVSPTYADHPKDGGLLHPKYSADKKPKHRLIGIATVIIHEANEYLKRVKADIEKLRKDKKIGGLSGVERNNQEILFDREIETQNLAGYVPLIYPNLSKKYSSEDKKLFGLENTSSPSISKGLPRSLGKTTKENSIYSILKRLQWRLAEKYVRDRNPNGELLWVYNNGKFNRFRVNQQLEKKAKKAADKKGRAVRKLDTEFKDAASAVQPKPVQGEALGPSQDLALTQQLKEKLKRVGNPEQRYDDADMKSLGEMLLSPDVHHIAPAIIYVANDLNQSISDGFINDPTKQHAIITIHSGDHFMGVYLHRATDGQISIIYFDPTVSKQDQQPLHNLPPNVTTILAQRFPTIPIINVGSEIQTYTTRKSGLEEFNDIDNLHCGPFVLCVMTEMSKGNVRLNPNGTRKLQIKFSDGSWKDLPKLSQEQSNYLGQTIRNYHLTLLASSHGADNDHQIDILRSLIPMPLETMSVLESALPKVPLKKVLKK